MWNRVVLLTCGMAFGWGLANYWTAPWPEIGKHRYRLIASAAIGLLLVAALAWEQLESGLVALMMLLGSAAICYAANAKQVGKPVREALNRPESAARTIGTPAIILVANAEPERYAGPAPWVERMRQQRPEPHWLLRPFLCHRIRQAYLRMPSSPPSWRALRDLAAQAQAQLGEQAQLHAAPLRGEPSAPDLLRDLAERGHTHLVILPVDLAPEAIVHLRQGVVETRVREAGVIVDIWPVGKVGIWDAHRTQANLALLQQGRALTNEISLGPEAIQEICSRILEQIQGAPTLRVP